MPRNFIRFVRCRRLIIVWRKEQTDQTGDEKRTDNQRSRWREDEKADDGCDHETLEPRTSGSRFCVSQDVAQQSHESVVA